MKDFYEIRLRCVSKNDQSLDIQIQNLKQLVAMTYFKIKATGKYLPETILSSQEIEIKRGYPAGLIIKSSGIVQRHIVTDQSTAYMAAQASFDVKSAWITTRGHRVYCQCLRRGTTSNSSNRLPYSKRTWAA